MSKHIAIVCLEEDLANTPVDEIDSNGAAAYEGWRRAAGAAGDNERVAQLQEAESGAFATTWEAELALHRVVDHYGHWAHGGDRFGCVAAWRDAGIDADTAGAWMNAGCFDAAAAAALGDFGIAPSVTTQRCSDVGIDYDESIAYAVSNGDLSVERAVAAIKGAV